MEQLDQDICYRALQTRDPRFDGRLFVGVTSTGIYCRPICPARTAKRENCRFFPSAAAAQEAGFRACLRCRPDISPQSACWRGTSTTVSRALALIAEGFLDQTGESVETLATRVGIGERQLRRLFEQHLGASPIAVAQTRRVLFAKQLIHDTQLSMAEIAMAAGFGSCADLTTYSFPSTADLRVSFAAARTAQRVQGKPPRYCYKSPIVSLTTGMPFSIT
jgi:AraC family transcriptional regulator of adaptative response / DNA-3-methyladenine glycosylase II